MAQKLKNSIIFITFSILLIAYAISASRHLGELPVGVATDIKVGPYHSNGTTKAPMNGCVGVTSVKFNACEDMGPPHKSKAEFPVSIPGEKRN